MPTNADLTCYKGQTYEQNFHFKQRKEPMDLSGLTARAQIRPYENARNLTAEFDVTIGDGGKVTLELSSATTAKIAPGTYVWDLKMTENENVRYWIKGHFIVSGRVTE